MPSDALDSTVKRIPLGRLGTTEDIADCTVFAFSDAGTYITGTCFVVDGGMWHQSTITDQFAYPEIMLKSDQDLKVSGKKKSKL